MASPPPAWLGHLENQLEARRAQGLQRRARIVESPCGPRVTLVGRDGRARELLAFCSNDYLGLAAHPTLAQALADGAKRWGSGSGAAHLVSGHTRAHARLEELLAETQAPHIPQAKALFLSTGYQANLALLGGLADPEASFFCDRLNHASLIDGAMLARAWTRCEVVRYPHGDLPALAARMAAAASAKPQGPRFIVTDGVFSMDGDIAPLPELLALAEAHDAFLIVDDAHGFGVLGAQGRGSLAHFGLSSERLIYMGTLGKAAGVGGAFIAAHPTLIRWLTHQSRAYIYTTASPPALAEALIASLSLMMGAEGDRRREQLQALVEQLRAGVQPLANTRGWKLLPSTTGIQPLVVGSNTAALALSAALEDFGLWVPAIRPPTVPVGQSHLRIALSAAHTAADLNQLIGGLHAAVAMAKDATR